MADFVIVTDSTADLPVEYLEDNNIVCMNMSYTVDGEVYSGKTGKELPWKEFYRLMREEEKMPTTSQINPEEIKDTFEELIQKGNKEILYLAFSSGLSGTCNNGKIAAQDVMEEHPDVKIIVIDSLSASLGEGLFVYYAARMRLAGRTMEETAEWLNANVQNFVHVFTVDDLHHLYRGGRVSKTTAIIGTMAGIKPILHVDKEGHLIPIDKVRGRKKSLSRLVDYMGQHMGSRRKDNEIVFISHGDALQDAQYVAGQVEERFGIKNFMVAPIGPTVGTHSGPGTIALFFLGEER